MTETPCCACGSLRVVDLGPCRPVIGIEQNPVESRIAQTYAPGNLVRCQDCGLGMRQPLVSRDCLASLYRSLPATSWRHEADDHAAWALTRRLLQPTRAGDRILDVGAFEGVFLASLPPTWHMCAIEPSSSGQRELAQRGIAVVAATIEEPAPDWLGQFDVVTMFDVFEHLRDPCVGLDKALAYLRPGGRLLLSTGNLDCWSWRLLKGEHWYLETPQHIRFGSWQFFRWYGQSRRLHVRRMWRISHAPAGLRRIVYESGVTWYFVLIRRGKLGRAVARAMRLLSTFSDLCHKPHPPYTQGLKDHLLVELVKPGLT